MLYVMFIFAVGVLFTEIVAEHRMPGWMATSGGQLLEEYFGTLDKTVFTLYASISGGINWADCIDPLTRKVSIWMVILLLVYILFCTLCLMNVVTGIFLET